MSYNKVDLSSCGGKDQQTSHGKSVSALSLLLMRIAINFRYTEVALYIKPRTVSWMQFMEMHFVSLRKCAAVLWISPWFLREMQKYSEWRETNPDDFYGPGFEVLW